MRDRLVLGVLAAGFVAAALGWHVVGPWFALAVGLIAVVVACVVYRVEAPRIDVDHPERWGIRESSSTERIDQ